MVKHYQNSGLQVHSLGELYPWSVVVYRSRYARYVRAENLVTGECGPKRYYNVPFCPQFENAHRLAELDARKPWLRGMVQA